MLTLKGAEIVSRAVTGGSVCAVVLDHMTDIHHAVCLAPRRKPLAEALGIATGHNIHIGLAHALLGVVSEIIPQSAQHGTGIIAVMLREESHERFVPRVTRIRRSEADDGVALVVFVMESRLV